MCNVGEGLWERAETRGGQKAIIELLGELGEVSEELQKIIEQQQDKDTLSYWLKLAAKADSIDLFKDKMNLMKKNV